MALLMPDINLRRKRKYLDRHWRKVLREDHDKISLKGLVPVSVISIPRSDTSARSHIIARSRVTEPVADLEDVNEPDEEPPIAIIVKEVFMGGEPLSMNSYVSANHSGSRRRSKRAVSPSPKRTILTPHESVDTELLEKTKSSSTQISSSSTTSTVSAPRSAGKPKSNSKYITRVKGASCMAGIMRIYLHTNRVGQTLGTLIYRVHENEDNIMELDFSYLAQRNKRLEAHGTDLVARALSTNRTVVKLVIRDHDIGDVGVAAIANMLRVNSTLEYMDLYGNNITDEGAEALAQALYGHESLTYLSLWSNQISNRGALALAEALKCNQALKYLGLVHNRITESGASALLEALDVNIHLETLNLAKNQLSDATTYKIRLALARNRLEAPKMISEMEKDDKEVAKRFAEMLLAADSGSESSGVQSCSDGYLSNSGVDQLDLDSDASGYWV